ncbi:hypothetical protein NliqN6_1577 [Naganishia liquefaciens]|uniref:Autophagy-related protein 13 n=1 Tax=Naganishia liquefaciens TaxID=104408 RepID=A0A8H3TQ69_9TREE|nr:hypothetical protein NliqN6_1577 [Naganishia liquefaciens]
MADISRSDQIVHRFYVKTLGVLADARLRREGTDEPKLDKWFDLPLPDYPHFRQELVPYRYLSQQSDLSEPSSPSISGSREGSASSRHIPWASAPPLLISITLDTTSIPTGQRLHWRNASTGERIALRVDASGKGKSRRDDDDDDVPRGIVLERWSLRVLPPPQPVPPLMTSSSSYRAGIAHFRAMQPFVQQLPAQILADRLRSGQTGLKIGIRVSSADLADAMDDEEMGAAYRSLESGLVGLQEPFDPNLGSATTDRYTFPAVALSNGLFQLDMQYRQQVDFWLANDTDETVDLAEDEYFTPTIRPPSSSRTQQMTAQANREVHANVSAGLTATRPDGPLRPSRPPIVQGDSSRGKWSSTESLPFAVGPSTLSGSQSGRYGVDRVSASPTATTQFGRRYSGLGNSGDSGSRRAPSPSAGVGLGIVNRSSSGSISAISGTSYDRPSSLQRPSSYLSQSGRSFTQINSALHASPSQGESPRPRLQSLLSSPAGMVALGGTGMSPSPGTPPFLGAGFRTSSSPSTSYTRPSSFGSRGLSMLGPNTGSPTPPIPESHEGGDEQPRSVGASTSVTGSRNMRRYSSSFGQGQIPQRRPSSWLGAGSTTSSGDPGSLVFGASSRGEGSGAESRRLSARGPEGFDGRRSSVTSLSRSHATPSHAEKEAINDFLRTLDILAEPPESAWGNSTAQTGSQDRSEQDTPPLPTSRSSNSEVYRRPLTKSQVDEALRRMAGSYTPPFPAPSAGTSPRSLALPKLTATPPTASERPLGGSPQSLLQRHSSSVKSSSPLAGEPIRGYRIRSSLDTTASQSESTSASAASSVHEPTVEPLTFGKTRSAQYADKPYVESGGISIRSSDATESDKRRGTVLLRGGFGQFDQQTPSTREKSPLTSCGSGSPAGSNRSLQSPRAPAERELSTRYRQEGERNLSLGNFHVAPILSAGAQPLDQGVRSWTSRRSLRATATDTEAGLYATPTTNIMYTAPASLESRRLHLLPGEQRRATSTGNEAYTPTLCERGDRARRSPPSLSHKASEDGDDTIVGNLELSGM